MPRLNASNNARSKLMAELSAEAMTLTIEDASSFPEPPFLIVIGKEIIEVGEKQDNTFNQLIRGCEGTVASIHPAEAYVEGRWTAGMYNELLGDAEVQAKVDTHASAKATLAQLGHVNHSVLTATLDTTWTGTEAPFTKTQTVTGILATDTPIVDVVMSGVLATDEARQEAWAGIYRITTADNSVTLYATEKPAVELPIQIKVVR